MYNIPFFEFEEHTQQINTVDGSLKEWLPKDIVPDNFADDNKDFLCINKNLQANYFIGMRWLKCEEEGNKKKGVLWVKPKKEKVPYERILWKCLNHPVVNKHLDECYKIFPEEEPIPLPDDASDFITPLLITDFLVRVQKIVKKGLKKEFVSENSILNNKIKGKILVNSPIKHQLKRNAITQTHCSYQIHTPDCIDNQIIKAAILQAQKYIIRFMPNMPEIKNLLYYNLIAFEGITTKSINPSDFSISNHSAFFKEYKPVLNLARLILKGLGFSINSDISLKDKTVPPFYINMPELFERYCEVLLRNTYKSEVKAGYQRHGYSETRMGNRKLRPDFLIPSKNMIIDCKYKYWIENSENNADLGQLALYSRHIATKQFNSKGEIPTLFILYPKSDSSTIIDFENDSKEDVYELLDFFKYSVSFTNI